MLKERKAMQTDLDRLERWACEPHEVQQGQVQGRAPGLGQSQAQIEAGRRMAREQP